MKEFTSIKPKGGVSRIFDTAHISRPYRLQNCQMELGGSVRSVNKPTVATTSETDESKPYVQWNGAVLDRGSYALNEAGSQVSAEAISDSTLSSRLYRSVKFTNNEGNTSYRVVKFYNDWDETTPNSRWQGEPAICHSETISQQDYSDYSFVTGVALSPTIPNPNAHVGYIAIPYDKNGEAGPWFHFTASRLVQRVTAGAAVIDLFQILDIVVGCGPQTEKVDIYRTMDYNDRGFVHTGPIPLTSITEGDARIEAGFSVDHAYYYYDTFHTSINSASGDKEILFTDNNVWVTSTIYELMRNEFSDILEERDSIYWSYPFTAFQGVGNRLSAPQETLQKGRNYHSIHVDTIGGNDYQYHGPSAEVMSTQGDIILYGNVRIPTKRPTTGVVFYKPGLSFPNIDVQLEYVDSQGRVYYGPKETFNTVESIKFAWQGERALLVFKSGVLFERLTPNEFGVYVTGFLPDPSSNDEGFAPECTYTGELVNGSTTFDEDPGATLVDYFSEPNLVLLSAVNRGMEVSFDAFNVKSDETVRAIVAARLAESESIRDYDFYVFTDKSVTLYKRIGDDLRTIVPVHNVTNRLGVKQSTYTAPPSASTSTTVSLVTPTRFGVAFIGTDDRIYHLTGRDLQQLDIEIPGLFSDAGPYRDIQYHPNADQIWVLFDFATIWVYDFIQNGWIRNHVLDDVHYNLYYNESTGNMHSWGLRLGATETFLFDENPDNIHELSQYITQPIDSGGGEYQVVGMQVDYSVENYSPFTESNWTRMRHSVRSPKIARIEEDYDPADGRRKVEYVIPANRTIYPTLVGRGHQFRFYNFQEIRDLEVQLNKVNF